MAEEPEQLGLANKDQAAQDKALDQLTDHVEEKEMDANKVSTAMAGLIASQKADREAQRLRDKQLAAVKVNKEDVNIIAAEFELDTKTADRRLREHSGNLVEALQSFL
ncbi:hypothetical protein ABBQ32_012172 [Trebouxia sp. C0010 RCD-2024]